MELESQVVTNILSAERVVRLGLAGTFGFALLGNAMLLLREGKPSRDPGLAAEDLSDPPLHSNASNPFNGTPVGGESANGSSLGLPPSGRISTPHLQTLTRASFQLGVACIVAFCTLLLVNPASPVTMLVYLGVALVLSLATLYVDRAPRRLPALSFLASGLIWLLVVGVSYFASAEGATREGLGYLAGVHIATATLASGLFVAAFLASLLYLVGYRWLKTRRLARRPALPSLEFLDNLVERTSVVGLFLITTSLVSGLGLLFTGTPLASVGAVKIVWAFAVWGLYSVSIFGRGFWGWRGRKGALLSVYGTLLIAGSLFGTLLRT